MARLFASSHTIAAHMRSDILYHDTTMVHIYMTSSMRVLFCMPDIYLCPYHGSIDSFLSVSPLITGEVVGIMIHVVLHLQIRACQCCGGFLVPAFSVDVEKRMIPG